MELKKVDRVQLGKRSKNKGSSYERTVAKKFKDCYGIELVRTPQSGGFVKNAVKGEDFKGDIVCADSTKDLMLHIECKNTKNWSMPAWIKQATDDCPKSKMPIVVFHQHGTSRDYVAISLDDFFKIVPYDLIFRDKGESSHD